MVSIALLYMFYFNHFWLFGIAFIPWNEIVLAEVAKELYGTDALLFVVVFGFGIVVPIIKMIASLAIWYVVDVRQARSYSRHCGAEMTENKTGARLL